MSIRRFIINASSIAACATTIGGCDAQTAMVAATPRLASALPARMSVAWQDQTGQLVAASRMSPLAAGRVYAAVSMAQYRAINAVDVWRGQGEGTLGEARQGAVAAASVQVLSALFPPAASTLEQQLNDMLGALHGTPHDEFARGIEIGRTVGDAIMDRVKTDGFTQPWTGQPPTGAGIWTPVSLPPAGIVLGNVKPYFLTSGSQFRPVPPPVFGSPEFAAGLNEVVQFAQNRTPEQIALAKSWDYAAGTTTPVGYWNGKAVEYIAANGLDEMDATRVLSLMHAAVFDAQIACWDAKYTYWLIRPYQANTSYSLVLGKPNHPSYPSGHSCVSASAGRVLAHFFPDRAGELDSLVTDAGMSRVYAGIHYRFDIMAGQTLGNAVADWAIAHAAL